MTNPFRKAARVLLQSYARKWQDYSRLIPVQDINTWSIRWDMLELTRVAQNLNIKTANPFWHPFAQNQALFLGSQFFLLSDQWFSTPHRIGTAYFHGRPGTGYKEFDDLYRIVQEKHSQIDRIQVSHSEMHDLILETGIDPHKVFRIPIGINLDYFKPRNALNNGPLRKKLGIPESAVVIGSFQKDGNGMGEGLTPKLIKGPDIFIETLKLVREHVPDVHVLLTGPARGYVKKELTRINIPFTHSMVNNYPDISKLYQVLDLYLVASRQEGGPKAILESMASGVPLVTTRVGQAMDIVRHQENGWMVESEDVEGLAHWTQWVLEHPSSSALVSNAAFTTARDNSYPNLLDKWAPLMEGFVNPH